MKATEARKLAEQFTPNVKEVLDIVKREAELGKFSTNSGVDEFLDDSRVRNHLKLLGYSIEWHEIQRYGYWEISW